jgi:cytoskeleton protein RodZ
MTSVGETLRRERLRRNLDLDTIARETKISARFLDAIESEDFDKLPGGVFARSFVRQYARLLELDDEELVGALDYLLVPPVPTSHGGGAPEKRDVVEDRIPLPRVEEWQSPRDSRFNLASALPAAAGVIGVMLACSLIYGWWQRSRQAPEPSQITAAETRPPAPQAVPQTTPPVEPEKPPEQAATPATAPPQPAQEQPAATSTEASRVTPAAGRTVPPSPPANANAVVRVVLTAQEPTWVLVRSDGKFLFSGTLDTNETRAVDATENVLVRLGNAGGVNISYNGKSIGAAGPKGQVRTLQFTSGGFQAVLPPAPAAPKPAGLVDPL